MSHEAYPSQANISTFLGAPACEAREFQFAKLLSTLMSCNEPQFVYSGLDLSPGSGLAVNISAGEACVDGRLLKTTGIETLGGLVNDATNYIYLQAFLSEDILTGFGLTSNTTGNRPANSVLLGTVGCASGVAAGVEPVPKKPKSWMMTGSYVGEGGSIFGRKISLPQRPRLVLILETDLWLDSDAISFVPGRLHMSGFNTGTSEKGFLISAGIGGPYTLCVDDIAHRPQIDDDGFGIAHDDTATSLDVPDLHYTWWAWF